MTEERDPTGFSSRGAAALRQALELHQKGRLEEAERLYRDLLASRPNDADALHFIGVLKAQRGQFEEAADLIGRSVSENPANPIAHYNQGNVLRDLKRNEDALVSYDRALAVRLNDPS